MILDLIYGYSKPLEKASYYTKSKGRNEESIGRVFKKLILVKSSYTWNNYFEITFMFSVQSLLVGNGTSVTCLRKSREPITALNVATHVTPLMVRNFWLWLFLDRLLFLAAQREFRLFRSRLFVLRWRYDSWEGFKIATRRCADAQSTRWKGQVHKFFDWSRTISVGMSMWAAKFFVNMFYIDA